MVAKTKGKNKQKMKKEKNNRGERVIEE